MAIDIVRRILQFIIVFFGATAIYVFIIGIGCGTNDNQQLANACYAEFHPLIALFVISLAMIFLCLNWLSDIEDRHHYR